MSHAVNTKALWELGVVLARGVAQYQAAVANSDLALSDYQTTRKLIIAGD